MKPSQSWQHRNDVLLSGTEGDVEHFMWWPTIRATMAIGDVYYVRNEYAVLPDRWLDILEEPGRGNPIPLPFAPHTSGTMVHQAFHAFQWERVTGKRIADVGSITEIGAGYGAFCLLAHRAGFHGRYTIVDLEPLLPVQRYYLGDVADSVIFNPGPDREDCDLLVAISSLSEIPITERRVPKHNHCLIKFYYQWDGESNQEFFLGMGDFYSAANKNTYCIR